jgi:SSS family solute:Na+ symporter
MEFAILDWLIVVAYTGVILAIGIYSNRYISSLSNYLVAGRRVRTGLAITTMISTELGLVTIAYSSQKGLLKGFAAFHIPLIAMLMAMVVGLTGFIIYRLRRARVMTIPEYYEQRYGRKTRILGGVMMVVGGVLNMGMFLYAGSVFIAGITGLYETAHINIIMTVLLLIVFAYTILGGMVSVVITDYLQFGMLGLTFVVVTAFCLSDVGWEKAVRAAADGQVAQQRHAYETSQQKLLEEGRQPEKEFTPEPEAAFDPFKGIGILYMAWMFIHFVAGWSLWQPATLRALMAASPKIAKRGYFWSSLGFLIRFMVPYFWGICAVAFLMEDPDSFAALLSGTENEVSRATMMATPLYIGQLLPAGIKGFVVAGLLASFMSTHDSYLLCWSASIVQDVVGPLAKLYGREISRRARLLLTRIFIFLIGLFLLFWGLWFPLRGDVWDYMAVTGTIYYAGAFAVVAGGLYWRRASSTGATLAILAGILAVGGILPWPRWGVTLPPWSTSAFPLGAMAVATVALVAGSLLFPDRTRKEAGS